MKKPCWCIPIHLQCVYISSFLHPPVQFNHHCLSPGPAVIPMNWSPSFNLPPLHTSVQPVPLTSYSGGFILLYIQYHKLTFIHELLFFTLEGPYRITLNRIEINFEWYHAPLLQGGTIQVENCTWMFCKGRFHAQQWWPQEVCLWESQPCHP